MTYDRVKRVVDATVAGLALLVLWPVVLAVALLVRLRLGSPVLFRQERPGLHGRTFTILKFRTMLPVDEDQGLVDDADRLPRFGALLRATSLDELPELVNVLRGDMSLVGPRPLRTAYLPRYTPEQARRHDVRPGVTGLAQVSGRNALDWDDRFALDVEYVDTRGPVRDARILLRTVATVLRRDGIAEDGQTTMSTFYGPRRLADVELRPARPEDLERLADWLTTPSLGSPGLGIGAHARPDRPRLERALAAPGRCDVAAVDRRTGEVLALGGIRGVGSADAAAYLCVEPRMRGRDIEHRTLQLLQTEARARGLSALPLGPDRTGVAPLRAPNEAG